MKSIIYSLMLLLVSCGNDTGKKQDRLALSHSTRCEEVNLHDAPFKSENLKNIFQCFGWDSEFPNLYRFSQESRYWDSFFTEINSNLVKGGNRDRLITFVSHQKNQEVQNYNRQNVRLLKTIVQSDLISQEDIESLSVEEIEIVQNLISSLLLVNNDLSLINDLDELLPSLFKLMKEFKGHLYLGKLAYLAKNLSEEQLKDVALFFIEIFKSVHKDAAIIENFLVRPVPCVLNGLEYHLDYDQQLYESANLIVASSINETVVHLYDLSTKFMSHNYVCDENPEIIKFNRSANNIFKQVLKLLEKPGGAELLSIFMGLSIDDENKDVRSFFGIFKSQFIIDLAVYLGDDEKLDRLVTFLMSLGDALRVQDIIPDEYSIDVSKISKVLNFRKDVQDLISSLVAEMDVSERTISEDYLLEWYHWCLETDPEAIRQFFIELKEQDPVVLEELVRILGPNGFAEFASLYEVEEVDRLSIDALETRSQRQAVARVMSECLQAMNETDFLVFENLMSANFESCREVPNDFFPLLYDKVSDLEDHLSIQNWTNVDLSQTLFSPEMFEMFLGMVFVIDSHLDQNNPNYVRDAIDFSQSVAVDSLFLQALDNSIQLGDSLIQELNLWPFMFQFIHENEEELSLLISNRRSVLSNTYVWERANNNSCEAINREISDSACLTSFQYRQNYDKIKNLLLSREGLTVRQNNLLKNLLSLVWQNNDVPREGARNRYRLSVREFVDFVRFLNEDAHRSIKKFHFRNGYQTVSMTLAEQLEVMVREVGFNNNFYTYYFINEASKFENFTEDLEGFEGRLDLLLTTGGLFRSTDFLDPASRWGLKNVKETIGSLYFLANQNRGYEKTLQAIMTAANLSTPARSRNYGIIRPPSNRLARGHRGEIIATLAELSIFTRLGVVEKEYLSDLTIRNLDQFINNVRSKVSLNEMTEVLTILLENNQTKNTLKFIVDELKTWPSDKVQFALEKFSTLLVQFSENDNAVNQLMETLKVAFGSSHLQSITRIVLPYLYTSAEILDDEGIASLVNNFLTDFVTLRGFQTRELLGDSVKVSQILRNYNNIDFSRVNGLDPEYISRVLTDRDLELTPLIQLLASANDNSEIAFHFMMLWDELARTDNGRFGVQRLLESLYSHPDLVEKFLEDAFSKVEYSPYNYLPEYIRSLF